MFIDEQTQIEINANLNERIIEANSSINEQWRAFLDVIKNTPEYVALTACLSFSFESREFEERACVLEELEGVLEQYTPEGYYFGTDDETNSYYGFWENV